MIWRRLFRFIVGLDQALNPIIYNGSEDVTLSAQTAYNEIMLGRNLKTRKVLDWVFRTFFNDHQHCYRSLLAEIDEFSDDRDVLLTELGKLNVS